MSPKKIHQKLESDIEKGLGKKYVKFTEDSFSWQYLEKPAFDKLVLPKINKKIKILEAGCGNGRIIEYLLNKGIPSKNIVGLDIDDKLLKVAKNNFPLVRFLHKDLSAWKSKEKFDFIICNFVLHYFGPEVTQKILKNFYLSLKSGGLLYFMVPHPIRWVRNDLKQYFKRKIKLVETPWNTKIPYFHKTIADYMNLTIGSGFEIVCIEEPEVSKKAKKKKISI